MTRTTFRPETDGFAFTNSWTFDDAEKATLETIVRDGVVVLEGVLSPLIMAVMAPVFAAELAIPFVGPLIVYETVKGINDAIVNGITGAIEAKPYGLCGGMAFASLDYWHKQWVVPRGTGENDQPQRTTPQGTALRDYIWGRLLTSVQDNVGTFLSWMGILHLEGGDGEAWLRDHSKSQLGVLRGIIDSGTPVTLGLIGTTWNPLNNHQVLCYGYEDHADGTTTLFLYDNNAPGVESTTVLDFSGSRLNATESCSSDDRGPLRGFFCTSYSASTPPKAVVLRQGLSFTPGPFAEVDHSVGVHATLANIGYHASPQFQTTAGDATASANDGLAALAENAARTFNAQLTFHSAGNHHVVLGLSLGIFGGVAITKVVPPENGPQASSGTVVVFRHRVISVARQPGSDGCVIYGVAGGSSLFSVDTSDMGPNVSYHWTTSAGTGHNANSALFTVDFPNQVGEAVTISVTVTRNDGATSSGSFIVTTISDQQAALEQILCEIRHTKIYKHLFPFQILPDPPPDRDIRVKPEEFARLQQFAARLTDVSAQLAKSKSAVVLSSTTVADHARNVANVANVVNVVKNVVR